MNLAALQTATYTRLGVPATDAFFTSTNIIDLINASIQFISEEADWYWLETSETIATVNGTESYATAAASRRTILLYDSTGIPLERRPLDDLVHLTLATGTAVRFFGYRGSNLILRPVPSNAQNLTHVYVGTETRLAGGTDTPAMPSVFHDAIADYAAYLGHLRQGDIPRAEAQLASYSRWIETMKARAWRFADSQGGGAEPPAAAPPSKGERG